MAGYIDVGKAIETAEELATEYESVVARRAIVREDLRNAVTMKATTPEQAAKVAELFPARESKKGDKPAKSDDKPKAA